MSIQNPLKSKVHFTPITMIQSLVGGGANDWIDINWSALGVPIVGDALYVFVCEGINAQIAGVRPHGSALGPKSTLNKSGTFISELDSSGHSDCWRANSDNTYQCLGYIK